MGLAFDEREIVLRADFSRIEEGELLSVPIRPDAAGPRPPKPGELVYLLDGLGSGCVGFCAKVRDGVARMRLVLDTWNGPYDPPRYRRQRSHGGVHYTIPSAP